MDVMGHKSLAMYQRYAIGTTTDLDRTREALEAYHKAQQEQGSQKRGPVVRLLRHSA